MNRREGASTCPFCEDITRGKKGLDTQVWLHPNDFPPLQPPVGEAYVVIYNRDHHRSFVQLTLDEVNSVTQLWQDLYLDLASRYPTVMIFENSGEAIGQTQHHPHGQAYGVSSIPPILERELETVVLDDASGRGCPFCRVLAEFAESEYQVAANTTWTALLPPYVHYPYETHLYPGRHVPNLGGLQTNELRDLAELLLQVIRGYNVLFELHVEIQAIVRAPGKLKYAASSESLWGLWTNDSLPSQKAQELREAISKVKL